MGARTLGGAWLAAGSAAAGVLAGSLATPALAQEDDFGDPPGAVVQEVPYNETMNLNAALAQLGRNPRDFSALIAAGNAALAIGDLDAAEGFYNRAEQIMPGNAQAKAGLASALLRKGDPVGAIPRFEAAARAGASGTMLAMDRGLAYDLVGDNVTAQRFYREALAVGSNDEAVRRLALSLAISGDKRGSAGMLTPLLARQDKAAWRTRAFALAIQGQTEDAVAVVNQSLPGPLAQGIAPYLRYMPRLTKAQQAAAANLGQFPRASEIGRDDPRIASYVAASRPTALAAADSGLIPRGEPLGRASSKERRREESRSRQRASAQDTRTERRIAPPEPQPGRDSGPAYAAPAIAAPRPSVAVAPPASAYTAPRPSVAVSPPAPAADSREAFVVAPSSSAYSLPAAPRSGSALSATVAAQAVPSPAATAAPATHGELPALRPAPIQQPIAALPPAATPPIASTAPVSAVPAAVAPAPAPFLAPAPAQSAPAPTAMAPEPPPERRVSLAEAFSDIARPTIDATPSRGAVDIRKLKPNRPAPAAAPKPVVPTHPSRIWVQVATGRDKNALAFDWRRMTRKADALFKGKQPSVSVWGQTNRLLTGPFETEAAANTFISQLGRADLNGAFLWTSPAGQVVDALPVK